MTPGLKTSELWLTLAGATTVALNKKLGLDLSTQDVLAIAGLVASFVGSRWHQKIAAAKADAA